MIETDRRGFLGGFASFIAVAPAIVRVQSIMPVKAIINPYEARIGELWLSGTRLYTWTGRVWELTSGKVACWESQGALPRLTQTTAAPRTVFPRTLPLPMS